MSDWSSDVCSSDLTAPLLFGQRFMAPILRAWLDAHPAMTASALFVDRNVNLLEEGLDLALRIGELPDSSLAARRVGAVRRVVVASPAYLARQGPPLTPAALAGHRLIYDRSDERRLGKARCSTCRPGWPP